MPACGKRSSPPRWRSPARYRCRLRAQPSPPCTRGPDHGQAPRSSTRRPPPRLSSQTPDHGRHRRSWSLGRPPIAPASSSIRTTCTTITARARCPIGRSACVERRRPVLQAQRHLHVSHRARVRQRCRRPGRVPHQAARWRYRVPRDPEHAREPLARCLLDRDRRRARNCFPVPRRGERQRAREPFFTVHPAGLQACRDLVHAGSNAPVSGPCAVRLGRPRAPPDRGRRPSPGLGPRSEHRPPCDGGRPTGMPPTAGIPPQAIADATHPGGAGTATNPAAFFNVAFRTAEPLPSVTDGLRAVADAAWWRDRDQGTALAAWDISQFFATLSFAKLVSGVTDNSKRAHEPTDRPELLASDRAAQGRANFSSERAAGSVRESTRVVRAVEPGRLQPDAHRRRDAGACCGRRRRRAGLLLRRQPDRQPTSRSREPADPSIVIMPRPRTASVQPGSGAADVLEGCRPTNACSDHSIRSYTRYHGLFDGGDRYFKLGRRVPDLFARGERAPSAIVEMMLASLRNVPQPMLEVSPTNESPLRHGETRVEAPEPRKSPRRRVRAAPGAPNAGNARRSESTSSRAVTHQFVPRRRREGLLTSNLALHMSYVLVIDAKRDRPSLGFGRRPCAPGIGNDAAQDLGHVNGDRDDEFDAVARGFGVGDRNRIGRGASAFGNFGPATWAMLDVSLKQLEDVGTGHRCAAV